MTSESSAIIRLPHRVAEKTKKEARKLGLSLEKYVLDLVLRDLDPLERAREHIEVAKDLLGQAEEELAKGAEAFKYFKLYHFVSENSR